MSSFIKVEKEFDVQERAQITLDPALHRPEKRKL
jgi:hypothetical protein